jgi:hypothetical protein
VAAPVIEAADCTVSGYNTSAQSSWAVSHPACSTGDLLIWNIAWDDSTNVTDVTEPSGANGETLSEINATPVASASTEVRGKCWYTVCTGAWSAGTLAFTPSASETWTATVIRVPAGEFDAADPIGNVLTRSSSTTTDTTVENPVGDLAADDGGGTLVWFAFADADPLSATNPTGWTIRQRQDLGAVAHGIATRDAETVDSETVSEVTWAIAGDSWGGISYVVHGPTDIAVEIDTAGALTLAGQTADFSLTDLGEDAWAVGAWASGAWATGAWDVAPSSSDLSLDIDTAGALTVSGQPLTLATSIATANGSLTLAGQSVLTAVNVALSNGGLTLDGQTVDTDLTLDLFVGIDAGALTLAGQSLTAATSVALSHGDMTLAGQDVTPSLGGLYAWEPGAWATGAWAANSWRGMTGGGNLSVSIDNGSLTISGQTVTTDLTLDLFASIENGSLTITGQSATTAIDVALSHGSLTIDGQTVNATAGNNLAVEIDTAGALTVSGETVTTDLTLDLFVGIDAGALTVSGQTVTTDLTADLALSIDAGTLTINGQDVTASVSVDQAWASGAWAYGAWANNSWQGMVGPTDLAVTIDAGALSIAGQATKFAWSVPWTEGQLSITGQTVDTDLTTGLTVAIDTAGALSIAGQETKFQWTVPWDEGQLTLTGQTVAVELGDEIAVDIDAGSLTLAGQAVTAATNVALANGSLTIAGQSLAYGLSVAVDAGALTLSGEDLTPDLTGPIDIEIDAGNLTISGQELAVSGIEAPRDPMIGGSGPTRDDRKKFKKWLEKKPYQPIDVEIEAGTLSISGQQVGVSLTDRKPFTISQGITRPLLRLPAKKKPVEVQVDIDKLIAEELRYAEELKEQKRKRRRKQDDEILLLM